MISKDKIEQIARLARIDLSPEETERFAKEFSQILDFINQLEEVDTVGCDDLYFGEAKNNTRQDKAVVRNEDLIKKLMVNVPNKNERLVKTKKIKSN